MNARCFPYPEPERIEKPTRRYQCERRHNPWTEERLAELERLWRLGWSASLISRNFGGGFTRNAIIGKLHRLRLTRTKTAALADNRLKMRQRVEAGLPPMAARTLDTPRRKLKLAEPEPKHIPLKELNALTCNWPYGDGPFTFCGHPPKEGRSYCEYHTEVAHTGTTINYAAAA